MTRLEDMEHMRAIREREAAARRQEAMTRYGETLGEAYLGYVYGKASTPEEEIKQRETFAEAIVTILVVGTREQKVIAVTALLESFEAGIAPVARQATEADFRTAPIG